MITAMPRVAPEKADFRPALASRSIAGFSPEKIMGFIHLTCIYAGRPRQRLRLGPELRQRQSVRLARGQRGHGARGPQSDHLTIPRERFFAAIFHHGPA